MFSSSSSRRRCVFFFSYLSCANIHFPGASLSFPYTNVFWFKNVLRVVCSSTFSFIEKVNLFPMRYTLFGRFLFVKYSRAAAAWRLVSEEQRGLLRPPSLLFGVRLLLLGGLEYVLENIQYIESIPFSQHHGSPSTTKTCSERSRNKTENNSATRLLQC